MNLCFIRLERVKVHRRLTNSALHLNSSICRQITGLYKCTTRPENHGENILRMMDFQKWQSGGKVIPYLCMKQKFVSNCYCQWILKVRTICIITFTLFSLKYMVFFRSYVMHDIAIDQMLKQTHKRTQLSSIKLTKEICTNVKQFCSSGYFFPLENSYINM